MPLIRIVAVLAFLLCATAALAQSKSDYTLYENIIKFKAPSDWAVIMEKKDGNPQFIAFQVKDPADQAPAANSPR